MKKQLALGVDYDPERERDSYNRLVASWNEGHTVSYRDGALICDPEDPIVDEFLRFVNSFNERYATRLSVKREEYIKYDQKDARQADLLQFCINGYAGRGARESNSSLYRDKQRCKGCGFSDADDQLKPLVLSLRELKHKDFMLTSHLETIVSQRAKSILEEQIPDELVFQPVTFVREEIASKRARSRYFQLSYRVIGGRFAPDFMPEIGDPCPVCHRPKSVTTGRKIITIERASLPRASLFLLDELVGSSGSVPSRFRMPLIRADLMKHLKRAKLTGFYGEPVQLVSAGRAL